MRTHPSHRRGGFTLIEMMAVITIIMILAGIVIGAMGYVTNKQAVSRAKVQMGWISKALEEYKMDNGSYPATGNTDGIDGSQVLFKALYFDSDNDASGAPVDTDQKVYLPELDPINGKQGWTSGTATATTKIYDPWGNEYRYRSALNGATPPTSNANTQNPDFDLWSIGKDGKTNSDRKHKDSRDDIWAP